MRHAGPYRIVVLPNARKDARSAVLYFRGQNPKLALDFADILERALRTIEDAPLRWGEIETGVRRHLLPRFPFVLTIESSVQTCRSSACSTSVGTLAPGASRRDTLAGA